MIWIVVADSTTCRIYSYQTKPVSVKLIKEILHHELRLKKKEFLTTDKPGHYQTKNTARGAYSPHTDPKEVKIINFTREIAQILDDGRKKKSYKKFIIIAPPHIRGLILQQLDKKVECLLANTISKDYIHANHQGLIQYLRKNINRFL